MYLKAAPERLSHLSRHYKSNSKNEMATAEIRLVTSEITLLPEGLPFMHG